MSETNDRKPRRARGEGGLRFDDRRQLWIATVPRRAMSPRTFYGKTQSEVLDKRNDYLLDVKLGRIDDGVSSAVAPLPRNPSLGEWLAYWLEHEVKPHYDDGGERLTNYQPTTFEGYDYQTKHYVLGRPIAHVKLDQLRVGHFEAWFEQLRNRKPTPVSNAQAHRALAMVKVAINRAIERRDVTSVQVNPASIFSAGLRKPRPKKKAAPEGAKVQALYQAARGERLELVIHLGLRLGLRKQEICALRFDDFDLKAGRLLIRRRMNRLRSMGVMVRDGAKMIDEAEEQEVPLSNLARWTEMLEEHKRRTAFYAQMCRRSWKGPEPTAPWAYLFPNRKGNPMDPIEVFRWFKGVAARAGQPDKTMHEMRHDCASLAIASGMSLWEVSKLMRHSSTKVTELIYGHITGAHEARLFNQVDIALDQLLGAPAPASQASVAAD